MLSTVSPPLSPCIYLGDGQFTRYYDREEHGMEDDDVDLSAQKKDRDRWRDSLVMVPVGSGF
eukprot:scaffold13379_cov127-Skeletonema_dohrnii-CCMP3373.AAC.5